MREYCPRRDLEHYKHDKHAKYKQQAKKTGSPDVEFGIILMYN